MTIVKKDLPRYTREQVEKHNTPQDLWVIIDSVVYDLTKFADLHPGGASVLVDVAGKDATTMFYNLHRHEVLEKYARYQIGKIEGEEPQVVDYIPGDLSPVPYAEPTWVKPEYASPYYKESHRRLQREFRKFVDEHIREEARICEESGEPPSKDLFKKMGELNILAMRLGPGKHLHGLKLFADIDPKEFDYFHEQVLTQELCRIGYRGFGDALSGGMVIGLPPVLNFGQPHIRNEIVPAVLKGEKFICLAISEAFAGSDVAGMQCHATKSPCGKFFIVNGTKKWITNGTFADYFTTGVKTDKGLSVLLIPRGPGVETKQIKTSYSTTAGTAYVTFDNVKVPIENLLGKENKGLLVILSNFNHERWVMCCASARTSRFVVEECMKWASQRQVFGKPLISQAVIRQKLAKMIALAEATQNWLENITHAMCRMNYLEQSEHLAGQIALLKMFCTRAEHEIADEAVQIFGGRGITRTGMGKHIEAFHRTYKFNAILGGAEEILADLGVRQAIRNMPMARL
jgi:alkylation response protein AidB-like acyl-CoA dehydrogenase